MKDRSSESKFALRRIVVAVDDSVHAAAAAEAAADLAARFRAVLEGVYVEDEDLMNLARLPVSRVISFPSGRAGSMDAQVLTRHIRSESKRAQQLLETVARRRGLRSKFFIRSGRVETELVAAAGEADLLVLGVSGRRTSVRPYAGSVAVATATQSRRSVLVHRAGQSAGWHLLTYFDGTEPALRALDIGIALSARDETPLQVAIAAADETSMTQLRERAARVLDESGVEFELIECPPPTTENLIRIAAERGANGIVIGGECEQVAFDSLLAEAPCPILLAR